MPWITVRTLEGKTVEQKRGLVKDITAAVVKNLGAPSEAVNVDIIEYRKENMAVAGTLITDR